MKKLMIAAAAAAVAGGAFAQNIFDYKASVKYVDFKKASVKVAKEKYSVWFKVVKSAKLTGYLVTPVDCPCEVEPDGLAGGPCERYGVAPSFLVLQNKAANKYSKIAGLSTVKLMPANLLTEWWATKSIDNATKNVDLQAQGYLFSGVGKRDVPDPVASPFYGLGDHGIYQGEDTECRTAATQFLFGQMNANIGIDAFIEPFLDHAGFGKAKYYYKWIDDPVKHPCLIPGSGKSEKQICLTSLSGTLIGGSYACMLNATIDGVLRPVWNWTEDYLCQGWDNYKENAKSEGGTNCLQQDFLGQEYMYNVVCGTWSIKASKLVSTCSERADVEMCGQKLDRAFDLDTFDTPADRDYAGLEDEFVRKWFTNVQ